MSLAKTPFELGLLAQGLGRVAARLDSKEAATVCGQAAGLLTQAMKKTMDTLVLQALALGLASVAARLDPMDATHTLTQAMNQTTDPLALPVVAQSLAAVAARLDPKETSSLCSQAARLLSQTMRKTTAPYTLAMLAQGLADVTAHLDPKEAASLCGQAARLLTQTMSKTTGSTLPLLARGLAAVAAQLEPKEASQAASTFFQAAAMTSSTQLSPGRLAALLSGVDAPEQGRRATAVVAAVGSAAGAPFLSLPMLPSALAPLPCRFSTPELVEVLKHPLCVGQARRDILDQLENRYRQKFADQWDFIRFATEKKLDLDFTTPPGRPATPAH
jgi:hypothetical protein